MITLGWTVFVLWTDTKPDHVWSKKPPAWKIKSLWLLSNTPCGQTWAINCYWCKWWDHERRVLPKARLNSPNRGKTQFSPHQNRLSLVGRGCRCPCGLHSTRCAWLASWLISWILQRQTKLGFETSNQHKQQKPWKCIRREKSWQERLYSFMENNQWTNVDQRHFSLF